MGSLHFITWNWYWVSRVCHLGNKVHAYMFNHAQGIWIFMASSFMKVDIFYCLNTIKNVKSWNSPLKEGKIHDDPSYSWCMLWGLHVKSNCLGEREPYVGMNEGMLQPWSLKERHHHNPLSISLPPIMMGVIGLLASHALKTNSFCLVNRPLATSLRTYVCTNRSLHGSA